MAYPLADEVKTAARWRLPTALAVAAVLYLLLLALGGRLLNDADTFWQIAVGNWIMTAGHVPHVDVYSLTMAGKPWISSQWLAQVAFADVYALAGWGIVVVVSAAAIASAFGLLTRFLHASLGADAGVGPGRRRFCFGLAAYGGAAACAGAAGDGALGRRPDARSSTNAGLRPSRCCR